MAVYKHRGKWMYDFWKNEVRYRESGYESKAEAQDEEAKARTTAKKINTDFIKLCNSRLEELEMRRSKGHFERNKLIFKNLIKKWATKKKITREDVEEHLNEIALISKHTANRHLAMIKALYNHGIKRQWFDYNPTQGIEPFGIKKEKKYIPPREDVEAILSVANENDRKYLIAFLHTAARMREINKAKWEDVNFNENYILLRTRKAKNSDVSERKVPLTKTLRNILESLPRNGEYVFSHKKGIRDGKRYDNRIKLIRSLCEKAGVKVFTFHNLRHYAASKLSNAGVPLTDIQEILGHTRPTTTDTYLQSIRGSVRESINSLED